MILHIFAQQHDSPRPSVALVFTMITTRIMQHSPCCPTMVDGSAFRVVKSFLGTWLMLTTLMLLLLMI